MLGLGDTGGLAFGRWGMGEAVPSAQLPAPGVLAVGWVLPPRPRLLWEAVGEAGLDSGPHRWTLTPSGMSCTPPMRPAGLLAASPTSPSKWPPVS